MRLLFWIVLFVMAVGCDFVRSHRAKRVVAFRKGSTFFYRLNYKISSIPWTTIFAQASGFKVAWPLPDGTRSRRSLPDLHSAAEHMYESHGFDGHACLVQNICEALNYARQRGGAIGKILKLLASASNSNWTDAENPLVDCEQHRAPCPLQLISVDGFSEM
ncbi:uncharacterized protein LOC107036763 [Diachasma alloeum]|uniref:uncharacterized protein LOC107036763 n=1 Tax=Diachasma alloeum TaxID=454923 RepID=UPI0007381056|nr:uncharacterized protein LOC107036763 [Diachasma alloeum]